MAADKVEEYGSYREDVTLLAVTLLPNDLRSDVGWRPTPILKLLDRIFWEEGRQAEVCNPHIEVLLIFNAVDEYIIKLEIPVNDSVPVEEVNCK